VLHPWLKQELTAILAQRPEPPAELDQETLRKAWVRWQEGLMKHFTLPKALPPLRMLLVLDNLIGHKTPTFVLWLVTHGIMPLHPWALPG
jgi:hypothetical protein